ncbi:MAG: hypothetical protein AAF602_23420 [Myxococcota bacterium]
MPLRLFTLAMLVPACGDGPGFRTPTSGGVLPPETPSLCITVEPSVIAFGEHPVGEEDGGPLRTYAVRNTCLVDLEVRSIAFDQPEPPFRLEPPLERTLILRPGESRAFGVRFEPFLYLPTSARIRITSNDLELPEEVIALTGTGICEGSDVDSDEDLVPDGCDVCPDGDDRLDFDGDDVPDECDFCPTVSDDDDEDRDGVADACDVCPGGDDKFDGDLDGVPDDCDRCLLGDDRVDTDQDTFPDACDLCEGFSDFIDTDLDGVPEGCDICQGFNDFLDDDADQVPNGCDECPGFDDNQDTDVDGIPDGCDPTP